MSVSGISTAGGNHYAAFAEDGPTFTSLTGRLAVLALETQEAQQEAQRQLLAAARRDFTEALSEEVQALRDQADAALRGAVFEGALVIASGALQVGAGLEDCESEKEKWMAPAGRALSGLAQPLGAVVSHDYGAANAAQAGGEQQQASWEVADLRDALKTSDAAQDQVLSWASSMTEREADAARAILSNMA